MNLTAGAVEHTPRSALMTISHRLSKIYGYPENKSPFLFEKALVFHKKCRAGHPPSSLRGSPPTGKGTPQRMVNSPGGHVVWTVFLDFYGAKQIL